MTHATILAAVRSFQMDRELSLVANVYFIEMHNNWIGYNLNSM